MTENIVQQAEEMEALKSIFENRWQVDSATGSCSIDITKEIKLYITLVPEYPSNSLPKYELLAPELSAEEKHQIEEEFHNLFEAQGGEPLIYQMIMVVEEAVRNKENHRLSCIETEDRSQNFDYVEHKAEAILSANHLNIEHGQTIVDRKSVFQGHACMVYSKEDVKLFMDTLLQNKKIANATHKITAYRISLPNGITMQDCDDDGETKASGRMLEMLLNMKLENVMVVVTRWYGGIHLGPDRFRHINNAARQVLIQAGFVKS